MEESQPRPQDILQGHSNQNSLALVQKQRPVEQNRNPRRSPHMCSQLILNKETENNPGKKLVSSIKAAETMGYQPAEVRNKTPSCHLLQKPALNGSRI